MRLIKKMFVSILFLTSIFYNNNCINLDELLTKKNINPIVQKNRETLSKVKYWIEDITYKNSIFNYGLPQRVRHLIDYNIGDEITYSDLLIFLSQFLKQKINYLELGVSVGKNFFQVINALNNAQCYGFEFEKINPTLEKFFSDKKIINSWESFNKTEYLLNINSLKYIYGNIDYQWWQKSCKKENSLKKDQSEFIQYYYPTTNNQIYYLNGNVFDESCWEKLDSKKFNLIFSDAFHKPEGLYNEFEMIKKYDLLNEEEFIIIWDDLGGIMTEAFNKIWNQLYSKYQDRVFMQLVQVRGWLGINEYLHTIGIIAKLNI